MSVKLELMTRELFHELWRGFEYDPDLFMDMELYENAAPIVMTPKGSTRITINAPRSKTI